jgi:hypothetical protein
VTNSSLFDATVDWLGRTAKIKSAVLFGSSASQLSSAGLAISSSDLDLHLIVADHLYFERIDWNLAFPNEKFCFQACRAATGSVRKVTAVFASGQIDLIIVPIGVMRVAAFGFRIGLYPKISSLRLALNEMATCLHSGYRFLKGKSTWEKLYYDISVLPGIRLTDEEMRNLADCAICDVLWVFQKIDNGELIAAQHVLHCTLSNTNLRLWRELRRRQNLPLPSFGLGRRAEILGSEAEQMFVRVNADLSTAAIRRAAWAAFNNLRALMAKLDPKWVVPLPMGARLDSYR